MPRGARTPRLVALHVALRKLNVLEDGVGPGRAADLEFSTVTHYKGVKRASLRWERNERKS